jgi:hypothetical protein
MVPLFADHDAWGLYHASRPLSHTHLGLVVETFIVCYLGFLLIGVAAGCLKSLWRHVAEPEPQEKPRTGYEGGDQEFFGQGGQRIESSDYAVTPPFNRGHRCPTPGPCPHGPCEVPTCVRER